MKDWDAAEEAARWGLEAGRSQPFNPESKTARKALTGTVFKLLRRGTPGAELLKEMFKQNSEFPNPMTTYSVVQLVKWAVNQEDSGGFHAE